MFSHSVMSDSLRPHGLQHARPPCPSLSPRACSNSCPLSQCCHPTTSSSVIPFSSCLFFPVSESFPVSQLFTPGGQSTGASASATVLLMNIQGWFISGSTGSPLGMIGFLWSASVLSVMFWGHNMGEPQNTMPRTEASHRMSHCVIPLTWEVQRGRSIGTELARGTNRKWAPKTF